jgi:hypothetical protein
VKLSFFREASGHVTIMANFPLGNYGTAGGYLDDPYEGELFAFFLDLYTEWSNPSDREFLWLVKRAKLQRAEYPSSQGPISVQRGWWFSSHEQWKYLELPYLSVPINKRYCSNIFIIFFAISNSMI